MDNKQLYNSRIIDTYIKLIRCKYSHVNLSELLDYAKMKPYEVADQGHWFTQEQVDLFYKKLVKVTRNENIAREAGRHAASPETIGYLRQYVLGMVSPDKVFEMIGKATIKLTKSSIYESKRISDNSIEIIVTLQDGVTEKPFQCENRIGFFEAVVMMFNNEKAEIIHKECMFKGSNICRYIITWKKSRYVLWRKRRNMFAILLLAVSIPLFIIKTWIAFTIFIPFSIVSMLVLTLLLSKIEKMELRASLDNLNDSTDTLLDHINRNYNNARMANEIGQAISKQTNLNDILANVIQILENRLDYDRGMILLANQDKTQLVFCHGFGYSDDESELLLKTNFHLDRPESKGVFVVSFRDQRPFLINDFNEIESHLSSHSLAFAKKLGTQSFIVCPIICEGESLGILAVDNLETKRPLIESDMSLLMGIAPVIGISINNANLIDARVRQFSSILQVMAASIDARDNLTAGHSEKVTEYSLGICHELGLLKDYCEMIRVASLLHDYGKIGVPDAILKKDGSLTDEEYENVKSHAAKTREILEQINFEGIYREVPEIAGSHHEKIDGSGYPGGLKGKDIPLGAKILAVADFFEAITSKRHYRDPMSLAKALTLLNEKSGTHFDEKIVKSFIRYYINTKAPFLKESSLTLLHTIADKKRIPCNIPVTLRIDESTICANGIDVSVNGMFVAIEKEVYEGSAIALSFLLPDSYSGVISVNGRVAWVNNARERKNPLLPIGFGVEFLEINPAIDVFNTLTGSCREENSSYAVEKIAFKKSS